LRGPLSQGGVTSGGAESFGVWGAGAGGVGSGGRGSSGGFCAPQAKQNFPHQAPSWLCASLGADPQPPIVMGQKERFREETTTASAVWSSALPPHCALAAWLALCRGARRRADAPWQLGRSAAAPALRCACGGVQLPCALAAWGLCRGA
jgi:hypothetical protein